MWELSNSAAEKGPVICTKCAMDGGSSYSKIHDLKKSVDTHNHDHVDGKIWMPNVRGNGILTTCVHMRYIAIKKVARKFAMYYTYVYIAIEKLLLAVYFLPWSFVQSSNVYRVINANAGLTDL